MKFQLIIKSFLFSAFVVFAGIAHATDYYVSASGNDSNNGTSASTPWKSISKVESVCNAGTIHAGDRILFKCGDQFTGKAVIAGIWGHSANSGTATNPITLGSYGTGAKPVFLYPTGGSTPAESRVLFWFAGVDYWVIDGLNFTDLDVTNNKVTPANLGIPLYLGSDVGCNHWTVQNVDISLCGMGIVLVGDYNTVQNCNMTNFKNLKSTPNTGGSSAYEDYGANPFTLLDGNYNTIKNNYVTGGWSESLDFGFNGGFCEMFGSCSNNTFMYNTIIDCNGLSEFGANGATANSVNNLYAYNKLIDNGAMFYCNISGPFACQVGNVQFFNNTVVETNNSRFAQGSANAGAGVTSPEAISHLNVDSYMFLYNGSPTATTVYSLKNNIFNISNPLKICRSSEARLTHDYQVFKLSGGSTFALALNSHEVSTSAAVFANTTASNAVNWDLNLPAASPGIDRGTSVGIAADFIGTPVPAVPNAGIFETVTGASTLAAASTATPISCFGGTSTVTVTATGGTAPYTGTGTFIVGAGSYTYTVTDAAGTSKTTSITVTQPTALAVVLSSGTISVFGGTTTLTVSASGGTSGYTYKLNSGTYQSSNTFNTVSAGTYSVTVKDANGCTAVQTIIITQPAAPAPLVASATAGTIACNGGSATVTVSATGGVAPYSGTGTFTVTAGTYNYNVTDAAGTTASTSVTVSQPTAIAVNATSGTIAVYGGTTSITVNATGGTGSYSYKLNSGSYQSANTFATVAAGAHTVTVKDANGCISVQTITITQPAPPAQLVATATAGTIDCNGGTTNITVSATGGVAPYTGTGIFTVSAGTYNYTVTDANGTTATTSINVTQPSLIAVTISAGTIAVFGGTTTVSVNANGGTGAYTYKLNSGSYQSSNTFAAVAAGTHTVTVKDGNGCTSVKTFTLTQPAAPAQLIASSTAGTISCNGGTTTVVVSATGGVAPYTGTGSFIVGAGTYSYTVTDASGTTATTAVTITQPSAINVTLAAGTITVFGGTTTLTANATGGTGAYTYQLNGGSFLSSNVFGSVAAGTYTVTVKDANGCTAAQTVTITQPAQSAFTVTATATPITCNSQISTILVSASGGTAPYTGTGYFTGYAGTYTYTVTDANGASSSTTITITEPTAIVVTVTAAAITRTGGTTTVVVNATGGNSGTYTYQMNGGAFQSSNTFLNVAAGVYTINVKDANGCMAVYTLTLTDPASGNFKISLISKSNATCRGSYTGSIEVLATGGRAPYTYKLNNGRFTTSRIFNSLKTGIYRVTAKDANGNTVSLVTFIYDGRTVCPRTGLDGRPLTITAFPNPSTDRFSLNIASSNESEVLVEVMNMNGTKVYEGKGSASRNYVFGNNFPAGTYFVRVTQGADIKTTTIIKGR